MQGHSTLPMKNFRPLHWHRSAIRFIGGGLFLLPSLLQAHPGHYHPDETDEFDFLRSSLFHSHGAFDIVIAVVVIASLAVALLHSRPSVRVSALAAALGSLAVLPML